MEDQSAFTLSGDPDFWNTPYPIAPLGQEACEGFTARQQLAHALRWRRLIRARSNLCRRTARRYGYLQ